MKENSDKLKIGNKFFNSRLMLGTGKYKTTKDAIQSIESSECEIVTVAIRRLPTNLKDDTTNFLGNLDWNKLWLLFYFISTPQVGLEPTTNRLTADCSTTELLRISKLVTY